MLIDTHCHIQFDAYEDTREELLALGGEKNVGMIVVGCDAKSSAAAVLLAQKHASVWSSVGQHPTDTGEPFDPKQYRELAKQGKENVVAIGECGLDYYHLPLGEGREETKKKQRELFTQHLELAHELHLPLIIHCRDAHEDMMELLLNRFGASRHEAREHGVMHCFTGTAAEAQSYLDLGFLISFTGIITFATQYDEVVRMTPLEKIMVETDSPFLSPHPHRGKPNTPLYVRFVAEQVAKLKDISFDEVSAATTANAQRLFRLL